MVEVEESKIASGTGQPCTSHSECCGSCELGKCGPGTCVTRYRNGYCTVIGCAHAKTLQERACPSGSTCNRAYPGGHCQKICDLAAAASCRGLAADQLGDYECRAWNNLSIGDVVMADAPVCDYGVGRRCRAPRPLTISCDRLGAPGNPTKMSCRNLKNKILLPNDPSGFCLDDTSSGALP
jgi:hypothetical protein